MTITLQAVNELIQSLESAGELSIREQKFLKLAKAYQQLAAENVALKAAIDATIGWQQSTDVENVESVRMLLDINTPATDRIVAGIKSDGVEEFAAHLVSMECHLEAEWAKSFVLEVLNVKGC